MASIDTRESVDTPEGISIGLAAAGPVSRALAWIIDSMIFFGGLSFIANVLAFLGDLGMGLYYIVFFVLYWFYPIFFEVFNQGATPGKKALGLQVLHDDGTPVGWPASVIRNLLRAADFLPALYAIGFISMLSTQRFQRLGDIVAGTLVVYQHGSKKMTGPSGDVTPQNPGIMLSRDEQIAMIAFADRGPRLSSERQEELARCTGALVQNQPQPASYLYALAAWLRGSRQ